MQSPAPFPFSLSGFSPQDFIVCILSTVPSVPVSNQTGSPVSTEGGVYVRFHTPIPNQTKPYTRCSRLDGDAMRTPRRYHLATRRWRWRDAMRCAQSSSSAGSILESRSLLPGPNTDRQTRSQYTHCTQAGTLCKQ